MEIRIRPVKFRIIHRVLVWNFSRMLVGCDAYGE